MYTKKSKKPIKLSKKNLWLYKNIRFIRSLSVLGSFEF